MAIVADKKKYSINTKIYISSTNYLILIKKKKKKIDKIATSPGVYKRVAASPSDTRDIFFYFLAVSPGLYNTPLIWHQV
jgi:hypothetical protein